MRSGIPNLTCTDWSIYVGEAPHVIGVPASGNRWIPFLRGRGRDVIGALMGLPRFLCRGADNFNWAKVLAVDGRERQCQSTISGREV